MDVIGMIKEVAAATANVSKEIEQRSELNNSPAMQNALVYHRLQEVLDQHRAAIADEDLDAVRKMVAAPDAVPGGA